MQTLAADYKKANFDYWQSEYETRYPDTNLVKLYHHVLKHEMPAPWKLRALDYGCSNGTNAFFLSDMGFSAYGVDINKVAIIKAEKRAAGVGMSGHFDAIVPASSPDDLFFGGHFDLIVSWHTLCYFSDSDLAARVRSLFNQLMPGGLFVATMVGARTANFKITAPAEDGLRKMPVIERLRELHGKEHFVNFVADEAVMIGKFNLFTPIHTGYIDECYSRARGENLFHHIFVGRKPF
jgi:SAM-dependent methyltransferase